MRSPHNAAPNGIIFLKTAPYPVGMLAIVVTYERRSRGHLMRTLSTHRKHRLEALSQHIQCLRRRTGVRDTGSPTTERSKGCTKSAVKLYRRTGETQARKPERRVGMIMN